MTVDVSFEEGFDFGFYSGTSVSTEVPGKFPVAVNGHGYAAQYPDGSASSKFSHDSIPYLKPYFLTEGDINERTLNPDGGWRRTQETWHKGAGQIHLDYTDSDRALFRSSKGVNVWDRWQLTLLQDVTQAKTSVNSNLRLATAGGYLYCGDGAAVQFYDGTTWTDIGVASTVKSLCSNGTTVWIALASGVSVTTAGTGSATSYNDLAPDLLGFVKGRLMAAKGASLYNIVSGRVGTPTGLTVTPQGTPAATTYGYRVAAKNSAGETLACAEVTTTTGAAALSSTNFNRLVWDAMPGATGYDVFGRAAGSELKLATVVVNTYDDTGADTPSGALPAADTTATTPTALYTHDDPGWVWSGFATGDSCLYAAGYSGDYSAVYRIGIATDGITLNQPIQAGELPRGETCLGIVGYLGSVGVGTSKGVRKADQAASGELQFAPVIPTGPCRALAGDDRFVYFGLENFDTTSTGLGRMDLSTLNNTVPAYASDLMAAAQGEVEALVIWKGQPAFAVAGSGVYVPSSNVVTSGWISSGLITFDIPDPKVALYVEVAHPTPMVGSFSVNLAADDGPFTTLATRSETGQEIVISANETHGKRFELQLVLSPGADPTVSPVIRGYTLITLPASQTGETYTVGLRLFEDELVNAVDEQVDVKAELRFLKALRQNKTVFKYQEGSETYTATMEDYSWQAEFPTRDGNANNGIFWAVMKSLTPPSAS